MIDWPADVLVGNHQIGPRQNPFVIAEISGNHNGSLDRALEIVDAVAVAGATAVKLQTYRPDTITIDADGPAFRIRDEHGLWGGRRLYDLYEEAQTPWEWHTAIYARAREHGLVPFSSPFDSTAVELLESLGTQIYKIASAELVDLPLIRLVASTGKPMIMSTGMATLAEIDSALAAARGGGCREAVLLACTASYPAEPEDANLQNIEVLRRAFGVPVGLSDHTRGVGASVAAVALGASVIEKHVTLRRADGGIDSEFSLEPQELALLVTECDVANRAVGAARFGARDSEKDTLRLRRSLFVVEDVRAGDLVTHGNVRSIRPSGGLSPDLVTTVMGRAFTKDVARGVPLTWDLV